MNIAESMKAILKDKTHIFTDYWKEDIKLVLEEVSKDFFHMASSGKETIKNLRHNGMQFSFKDVKEAASDVFVILKFLPGRIVTGIHYFKEDLTKEMEEQPDQKHKTVFVLKVLGALTSFTLGTLYQVKRGQVEFSIRGLKNRNLVTQFIFAEILFKLTSLFVHRLLNELDEHVSTDEEKENIAYFRQLLARRTENEEESVHDPDHAIQIVENLKNYIMTGERA